MIKAGARRGAQRFRRGQVMILTVLALGGTLLGATTVAGLLTLYQVHNATDLTNSAKAIFAADAGLEWGLYNFTCGSDATKSPCPRPPLATFSNGASVTVECDDTDNNKVDCSDPTAASVKAIGSAGDASRALQATF